MNENEMLEALGIFLRYSFGLHQENFLKYAQDAAMVN